MYYIIDKKEQIEDYKIENEDEKLELGHLYVGVVIEKNKKIQKGTFAYFQNLENHCFLVNVDSKKVVNVLNCWFSLVPYDDWIRFPKKLQDINYEILDEDFTQ
jgi:hypothetical protein